MEWELLMALRGLVGNTGLHQDDCVCDNNHKEHGVVCQYCYAREALSKYDDMIIAHNAPLNTDTFVYDNTMLEDYFKGAWFKEDLPEVTIKKGLLFRPNSNIVYDEFKNQRFEGKRYCITFIDKDEYMKSFTNLSHSEVEAKIIELRPNCYDNHESFLNIFDMADAITLDQYEKELKNI